MAIKAKKRLQEQARRLLVALHQLYPDVECSLDFREDPFRLMVGAILAAQCTDARVNQVTPGLFAAYPTVEAIASAEQADMEKIVKSCGLFRMKAKNIRAAAAHILEWHAGAVPSDMKELLMIPGVGRKIANLILGDSFGQAAVVVDTHCARISRLMGLTKQAAPPQIERDLMEILPEEEYTNWGHLLVAHGRAICVARRPACSACLCRTDCLYGQGLIQDNKQDNKQDKKQDKIDAYV